MSGLKIIRLLAFLMLLSFSAKGAADGPTTQAIAVLHPTEGHKAHGIVTFLQTRDGVRIVADIEGLAPGEHGFHIHEYGDCGAPDAASAGGHFNPTHQKHGCPNMAEHHVGDLGNIEANAKGHAHYDLVNRDIRLEGKNSIIGRSVIVHADRDDCKTQPSGNSGARVACGVIGIRR